MTTTRDQQALKAANWLSARFVPAWLRLAGLEDEARSVEAHTPITWSTLEQVTETLYRVSGAARRRLDAAQARVHDERRESDPSGREIIDNAWSAVDVTLGDALKVVDSAFAPVDKIVAAAAKASVLASDDGDAGWASIVDAVDHPKIGNAEEIARSQRAWDAYHAAHRYWDAARATGWYVAELVAWTAAYDTAVAEVQTVGADTLLWGSRSDADAVWALRAKVRDAAKAALAPTVDLLLTSAAEELS